MGCGVYGFVLCRFLEGSGSRVWGVVWGFGAYGLGLRVWGVRFRVHVPREGEGSSLNANRHGKTERGSCAFAQNLRERTHVPYAQEPKP